MSSLVQIHIGPVQGFIATARRTRDLWFGSYVLSEVSKAAAKCLQAGAGVTLIFPAPARPGDLGADTPLPVANILLAEVAQGTLTEALALGERAKAAAQVRWEELCKSVLEYVEASRPRNAIFDLIRDDIWQAQRVDVLEVYVAVAPLGSSYADANNAVRELMARRKNTRNFEPARGEPGGLPKSSLDGARSSVLKAVPQNDMHARQWQAWRQRLGIEPGEQLDVAGMVKRVAGRQRKFVPAARVAVDAWLQRAGVADAGLLRVVAAAYEPLVQLDLASRLDANTYPWADGFAWDAQLLYPDRLEVEVARLTSLKKDADADEQLVKLRALRDALNPPPDKLGKPSLDKLGKPSPYYALLLADGDRMGEMIDCARSAEDHRMLTAALAAFASEVPKLVNGLTHRGACIYAGGDDVLALVRVDKAIACAKALSEQFSSLLEPVAKALGCATPTLSVGVAVCHMLEPLGDARELAHQAERLAKQGPAGMPVALQRNALGLIIAPRGGAPYVTRVRWDDKAGLQRLATRQENFAGDDIPSGLPYELRDALGWAQSIFDGSSHAPVPEAKGDLECDLFAELWGGTLRTLLGKKQRPDGSAIDKDLRESLVNDLVPQDAAARIDELLVARWLAGKNIVERT